MHFRTLQQANPSYSWICLSVIPTFDRHSHSPLSPRATELLLSVKHAHRARTDAGFGVSSPSYSWICLSPIPTFDRRKLLHFTKLHPRLLPPHPPEYPTRDRSSLSSSTFLLSASCLPLSTRAHPRANRRWFWCLSICSREASSGFRATGIHLTFEKQYWWKKFRSSNFFNEFSRVPSFSPLHGSSSHF